MIRTKSVLAAMLIAGALALPGSASMAAPVAGVHMTAATASDSNIIEQVQFRGRGGWRGGRGWGGGRGYGVGAAILGGAIIGGALAAPYYGRSYGYYPAPSYYSGPQYYAAPPPGNADAYCFSRFRSYDPGSGTYLGFDGFRHPCP